MDEIKRLIEQVQALNAAIAEQSKIICERQSLGFSLGRRFVYIGNDKRALWSFVDNDEPIEAATVTGYLIDLYIKSGEVPKLHIVLRLQDQEIVLCSGAATHFSRDVLAAIAQLSPIQLKRPLTIIPTKKDLKPGEAQTATKLPIYANVVYENRTLKTFKMKKDNSPEQLFEKAIAKLKPKQTKHQAPKNATQVERVNWKNFCSQHSVSPEALKALAKELNLPMGKLSSAQSATLYHNAYNRFVLSKTS